MPPTQNVAVQLAKSRTSSRSLSRSLVVEAAAASREVTISDAEWASAWEEGVVAIDRRLFFQRLSVDISMEDKFPLLMTTSLLLVSFLVFLMQLESPGEQYDVHEGIRRTLALPVESSIVESQQDMLSNYSRGALKFLPSSSVYLSDSQQLQWISRATRMPPIIDVPSQYNPVLGDSWSLFAWIQSETAAGFVVSKRNARGAVCWQMSATGGLHWGAHSSLITGTRDAGPEFTPLYTDGTWHHAGLVVVGLQARYFLDGRLVGEFVLNSRVTDCDGEVRIGEDLKGFLADVRFYPRAVSTTQVAEIMSIGLDMSGVLRGEVPNGMTSMKSVGVQVADAETTQRILDHTSLESQRLLTAMQQADEPSAPAMTAAPAVCEDSGNYTDPFGHGCAWFGSGERCQFGGREAIEACPLACHRCSVDTPAILSFDFFQSGPSAFSGWRHESESQAGMRRWRVIDLTHDYAGSAMYGAALGWVLGPEPYSSNTGMPPHPRDMGHGRIEARSPSFLWPADGHLEVLFGWGGAGNDVSADEEGFMGVAIVCNGAFVAQTRKPQNGYSLSHTIVTKSAMAPFVGQTCEIAVIDNFAGGWGWLSVRAIRVVVEPSDPLMDTQVLLPSVTAFPPALPAIASPEVQELAAFTWTSRVGKTGALLTKRCGGTVAWELRVEVFQYYVGGILEQRRCWPCYHVFKDENVHHFGFLLSGTGGHFLVDGSVLGTFTAPDFQDCTGSVVVGEGSRGTMYKLQFASRTVALARAQEIYYSGVRDGESELRAPMPVALQTKEVMPFVFDIVAAGPALALQVRNAYSECSSSARKLSRRFSDLLQQLCVGTYDCVFAEDYADAGNFRCVDRSEEASGRYFGHDAMSFHGEQVFAEFLATITDVHAVFRDGRLQRTGTWMDLATAKVVAIVPFVALDHSMLTICHLDLQVVSGVVKARADFHTVQPARMSFVPLCVIFCALLVLHLAKVLMEWRRMVEMRRIATDCKTQDSDLLKGIVAGSRSARIFSFIVFTLGIVVLALIIDYRVSVGDVETLMGPIVEFDWFGPVGYEDKLRRYAERLSNIENLVDKRNRLLGFSFVYSGALLMLMVNCMSCHLRLGMVQNTITAMSADLANFLLIWFSLLPVFSLTGYFVFGATHRSFSTVSGAFHTQLLAFVGEYPPEIMDKGSFMVAFWLSYVVLNTLLLINFLLAIIVDAYMAMKEAISDNATEQSIYEDIVHFVKYGLHRHFSSFLEILVRVPVDGPRDLTFNEFTSYWPEERDLKGTFAWHVQFFRGVQELRPFVGPEPVLAKHREAECSHGLLQAKKLGDIVLDDFLTVLREEQEHRQRSRRHTDASELPSEMAL